MMLKSGAVSVQTLERKAQAFIAVDDRFEGNAIQGRWKE
jgi:hypothetical protein